MGPGRGHKPSNPGSCRRRAARAAATGKSSVRRAPIRTGRIEGTWGWRGDPYGHDAVACRCSGAAASDPRAAPVDRPAAEGHGRDRIQGDALGGRGRKRGSRADHVSDNGTDAPHQPSLARSPTTPYIAVCPVRLGEMLEVTPSQWAVASAARYDRCTVPVCGWSGPSDSHGGLDQGNSWPVVANPVLGRYGGRRLVPLSVSASALGGHLRRSESAPPRGSSESSSPGTRRSPESG